MRNTITKTVSMFLVAVMVMGIAVMPFRASAGLESLTPAGVWLTILDKTYDIAKQMLNPINNSPNTSAISRFSAFFESTLQDDLLYVTAEQMNELSYWLVQNGISVMPTSVPGRNLIALCVQDTSVFIPAIDTTIELDVDVGDMYTYSGKTIVRIPGGSAAEEDRDSYTGNGSTSNNVGIGDDGQLVDVPTTDKDTGTTVGGGTFIHNETTNNWQVKNENGTYVDIQGFHYNPVTQTYHTTTNEWNSTTNNYDQRQYTYQFYYDYTYITYIGSSAEYREAYKVYYELPDGRSSGDLTVDELKGLSLQFDMINYDKAASDTLTRALYDFDGDLDNSSAFNSSAQWISGASTTYLEAPDGFGGALFNNNPFELRFSLDGVSNEAYTIQFRLYFENLPTSDFYVYAYGNPWFISTSNESNKRVGLFSFTLNLGDQYLPIIRINQGNVYFAYGDSVVTTIQAGQWYDFTICFDWSTYSAYATMPSSYNALYLYLNGLLVGVGEIERILYQYYSEGWVNNGFRDYTNDFTYFSFNVRDFITGSYTNVRTNTSSSSVGYTNFWTVRGAWPSGYYLQRSSGTTSSSYPAKTGNYFAPYTFNALGFRCDGSYTMMLDNLRVVNHSLYSGVQSFTPTPVPFDTNLVYVLPSVAGLNDNTVAIMSQLPVSGYRVGGIRPTDPTLAAGYVYMHIDGEFVDSVQQYNGSYWEEVTARLYTGIRWIPVTAFNVYTLEDMFDIIDPDADGGGNSVDSIYQYYLWWSGEWGSFQQWLQGTMQTLIEAIQSSNGGGGSNAPVVIVPGLNDQTTTNEITTENPDGSTTKTVIVSNAAGLVYSNSVTTYPTDAEGNTKTITVYTDSSGVMYQTVTIIDKDGNVTVTEPTQATGTLGSILKMITNGVMSIAGTVIEGFVTIVVDGVKFIIEFADDLLSGIGNLLGSLLSALIDFGQTGNDNALLVPQEGTTPILTAIYDALPAELTATLNLAFIMALLFGVFRFIHF